jgi:hypothetical protein
MPLQATSGAASYDAFGGGGPFVPTYIEDVMSVWLYTGNGSTQTITNGIDLADKGGLVWVRQRNESFNHILTDTARGVSKFLYSDQTNAQETYAGYGVTSFNNNGFAVTDATFYGVNKNAATYVSWTFRKQPKFFDVVTWTGNGANRTIAHNLGSVPGMIIVKRTDTTADWQVYHRSLANTEYLVLNRNNAQATDANRWNSTTPTDTVFSLGTDATVNASGGTYVAYVYAHNAGGFGLTGTDNVISCGSWTVSNLAGRFDAVIDIGWEPQWILFKTSNTTSGWNIYDNMRGFTATPLNNTSYRLNANDTDAEMLISQTQVQYDGIGKVRISVGGSDGMSGIYIAIRRGPMKVPTTGTSVFDVGTRSGSGSVAKTTSSVLTDLTFIKNRTSGGEYWAWTPRLNGNLTLQSNSSDANLTGAMATNPWDTMTGAFCAAGNGATNSGSLIDYSFRRAPSVFDVVCYTGTGSARTVAHNLAAVPQLMIVKCRSNSAESWLVYSATTGPLRHLSLNSNGNSVVSDVWDNTAPTSSVFSIKTDSGINGSGRTYVAYLFSSCPGVSRVGSYVSAGVGTTQTIDCGFTAGARFVLIKVNGVGDWYVWDSARGIVSGNDPYLLLNSTAAEVTSTDYIDTAAAGFEISSAAGNPLNQGGQTYIFLAIA